MKYKNIYDNQRKNNLLHRLLLEAIIKEKDTVFRNFNISRLKLQKDLKKCTVFYTFFKLPSEDDFKDLDEKINFQGKIWRQKIAKQWHFRSLPKLVFVHDKSLLELEKITLLFSKNKK